jgi:hypothetical protein
MEEPMANPKNNPKLSTGSGEKAGATVIRFPAERFDHSWPKSA